MSAIHLIYRIVMIDSQRPHIFVNVRTSVANRLLDHDPFEREQPLALQPLEVAQSDSQKASHLPLSQKSQFHRRCGLAAFG